jgi:hypothetical protein
MHNVTHLVPDTSLGNEEPIRLVQAAQKRQIWCFVHRFAVAMFQRDASGYDIWTALELTARNKKAWRWALG